MKAQEIADFINSNSDKPIIVGFEHDKLEITNALYGLPTANKEKVIVFYEKDKQGHNLNIPIKDVKTISIKR